jgi:phosphoglycerate dehydrogenase-like enzyme
VAEAAEILIAHNQYAPGLERVQTLAGSHSVHVLDWLPPSSSLPPDLIANARVLFTDFPPLNLADMRRLQWIQLGSAGYNQVLNLPINQMRVKVTNASGVNDVPIAEWCLLMMLMWERDMRGILAQQELRGWNRPALYQSEIRGRRVGILGYGNIGREVGRQCRAMGLEVWALGRNVGPRHDRYSVSGSGDPDGTAPHRSFRPDQLDEILSEVDYLVVTLALNQATRGLIGERELRQMRPNAVVINPARAHLVDEAALLRALREGWIAGAAIDSHYKEPLPPDHPLWAQPNAILTPHISGSSQSRGFVSGLWDLFSLNLERFLTDKTLLNRVSPEDLN